MADGSDLELQRAINATLAASTAIQALLGDPPKIYEEVPTPAVTPYVTFGTTTVTTNADKFMDASTVYLDLEIWSRETGFEESKRIASAIRRAIHDQDLTLATQRCVLIEHIGTRHVRNSGDMPMKQAIVTFHAETEEV